MHGITEHCIIRFLSAHELVLPADYAREKQTLVEVNEIHGALSVCMNIYSYSGCNVIPPHDVIHTALRVQWSWYARGVIAINI